MRKTSIGLLTVGAFIMISALLMNTTKDGIHNIGLLADRNVLLIFGGILFVAGSVILSAVLIQNNAKIKIIDSDSNQHSIDSQRCAAKYRLEVFDWWNSRTLGERVIVAAAVIAVISTMLTWTYIRTDVGTSGVNVIYEVYYEDVGNGLGIVGALLFCFWIYPITALWKGRRIGLIGGVACCTLPLIFSIWYIVDVLTDPRNTKQYFELTGGNYISTGPGLWLFAIASLGYLLGLITHYFYEPPQLNRDALLKKFLKL